MRITKRTIDRALTILAAAAAPTLSLLTRHHVITPADAVDLGTTFAAVVAAYHGGATVEKRRGSTAETVHRLQSGRAVIDGLADPAFIAQARAQLAGDGAPAPTDRG